jgi:hypothetical protein
MARAVILVTLLAVVAGAPAALATPYWTPEDAARHRAEREALYGPDRAPTVRHAPSELSRSPAPLDYLTLLAQEAAFITGLQVGDTANPEYGGMREGETGALYGIVQSDNTQESIWVWSHYYRLTGDDQFHPNVDAAWAYVMNNPGYDEEGGSSEFNGYYRMYNVGWGMAAETEYRAAYGDTTYKWYADSCANYVATHTLVRPEDEFNRNVNPPVLAWAAGNLYRYGAQEGSDFWKNRGANRGGRVKGWVEEDSTIVSTEEWAVSGGAVIWGCLESYFAKNPGEMEAWMQQYAPLMDPWADPDQWSSAHDFWYALGHRAAGEALSDAAMVAHHQAITDSMQSTDGDADGGIPATPTDPDNEDQTWVSNYMSWMGFRFLIDDALVAAPAAEPGTAPTRLAPSAPNPMNPSTTLRFTLAEAGPARLTVHDLTGALVAEVTAGRHPAGENAVTWDGRDRNGRPVASGVYLYRLETPDAVEARKLVVVR